jgi:hypothetical protein
MSHHQHVIENAKELFKPGMGLRQKFSVGIQLLASPNGFSQI